MPKFIVSLERAQKRSSDPKILINQLRTIVNRGIAGPRAIWECTAIDGIEKPKYNDGNYLYKAKVTFERRGKRAISDSNKLSTEMGDIVTYMQKASVSMKWIIEASTHDWAASRIEPEIEEISIEGEEVLEESKKSSKKKEPDFIDFDRVLTYDEIKIPEILIHGSDEEIESFPAFQHIYGRAAHIRIMAASMHTMLLTKGRRRNHLCIHGLPGCGKSSLFGGWQQVIGKGGFITINANSATRAGIEGLFLNRLKHLGGAPPFLFVEEIEKTLEQILTVWLSIMDERAEVRKIQHRNLHHAPVRSLVFATANDKLLFDRMMGGRPGHPGAISSRMTGIYVPRPDWAVMKRILLRDIGLYYPEAADYANLWAEKCIEIAQEIGTNDPRTVTCFLDGRTRLLEDDYKEDIMRLHHLEKMDHKIQRDFESGIEYEQD